GAVWHAVQSPKFESTRPRSTNCGLNDLGSGRAIFAISGASVPKTTQSPAATITATTSHRMTRPALIVSPSISPADGPKNAALAAGFERPLDPQNTQAYRVWRKIARGRRTRGCPYGRKRYPWK